MKIDPVKDGVFLISNCKSPLRDDAVCRSIASEGVHSLMAVAESPTPFAFRTASGLWMVIKPIAAPANPLPSELACIADFACYERAHGRTVGFWIGYESISDEVLEQIYADTSPHPTERPIPDSPLCCRPFRNGCSGSLLCHATPVETLQTILESGRLESKAMRSGMSERDLIEYSKENVGDPPDFYRYVMLGNGNCVAPDLVVAARRAKRFVSGKKAEEDFYPGVRLFFKTREMYEHPRAAFDGIHPVKIKDTLDLNPYLVALITPHVDEGGSPLRIAVPPKFADRIIQLDHREHYGLQRWSDAACESAKAWVANDFRGCDHHSTT